MRSSSYQAPATSSGVVTFLDVLGWKGVYNRIQNATVVLSDLVDGLRKQGVKHRGKVQGEVDVKSISDTIAIFTKCRASEASKAIDIHGVLAHHAIRQSISKEIPLRGAISYGDFDIQQNIFVGKAVDEAASWHEHADWIGVHLTPSAEYVFVEEEGSSLWVRYSPPNKLPLHWSPHCVNWTYKWDDRELEIGRVKDIFRRLGPIVPEIAVKLNNTLNFISATGKQPAMRWSNRFE